MRGPRIAFSALLVIVVSAAAALFPGKSFFPWNSTADEKCPVHFLEGRTPEVTKPRDKNAITLCFSGFAVRYSGATKTPIWSAARLTRDRVQEASSQPRTGVFHEERRIPLHWRAKLTDYRSSGYDRGHLSPSGDMPSPASQNESFSLANIIPQHPCSNQGFWAGLESTVRKIAIRQGELFVVTGAIYREGAVRRYVGHDVAIPDGIFKALYDPVSGRAAAYVAENADEPNWRTVSISNLSELTGIDVFPNLPVEVKADQLELPVPEKSRYRCRLHHKKQTGPLSAVLHRRPAA